MKKLKVISTGIHLEKFQNINQNKVDQLKKEFNINDEKVILFVGMLTERKHPEIVIEIGQKLLDQRYNIKTIIVGDAHGKNNYLRLVHNKYKDKIIFSGGRKDIPELMKVGTVLLLPSEGEGLPGVVMEAMASGLSVVASDEGCTPDLIENEKEGFLVKIEDLEGYYQAVKKLLDDDKLNSEISKNALDKIKKFRWEEIREKCLGVYEK